MTKLRVRTLEELERRNYSQLPHAPMSAPSEGSLRYSHCSPDELGPEEIRQYQLDLVDRELHPRSIRIQTSALRFLFRKVLRGPLFADDAPLPKLARHQPPTVLSRDEVDRLIDAAPNLRHRTILMTLYSTGIRCSESRHLRPEDIDRERMVIRMRQGKGGEDRDVALSAKLHEQLRTDYRALTRRNGWLFPSLQTRRPTSRLRKIQGRLARLSGSQPARQHHQECPPAHAAALCRVPDYAEWRPQSPTERA